MTESHKTYHPTFATRRILLPDQTPDDFREVTAAERTALEAAAAAWERPPQLFIDQWNAAAGAYGCYNEATGYFELNGLTDLTYAEAIDIMAVFTRHVESGDCDKRYAADYLHETLRTLMPIYVYGSISANFMFCLNLKLKALRMLGSTSKDAPAPIKSHTHIFTGCYGLQHLYGILDISACTKQMFASTEIAIETLNLIVAHDVDLSKFPKLSLDSMSFLIDRATNTSQITATLHPDTYAKITGDTTNAAAAALTPDQLASWAALTPLAEAHHITLATA